MQFFVNPVLLSSMSLCCTEHCMLCMYVLHLTATVTVAIAIAN
jgi:hypothetical protein